MKHVKVEVKEIRRKSLKMLNIVVALNSALIDIIYSNEIHLEILKICLHDDILVIK